MPPRARGIIAWLINVSLMFIFKVKTEPMHFFKEFIIVSMKHWLLTLYANRKLCGHMILLYLSSYQTISNLTPELTGREELYQAFNLADERQADSAPVE
jgi:hypothetical protein